MFEYTLQARKQLSLSLDKICASSLLVHHANELRNLQTNGCCWADNGCVPNWDCHWWSRFRFPMIHDDLKQDPSILSHHYHASRIPNSHPPNIIRWGSVSKDHFIDHCMLRHFSQLLSDAWMRLLWEEIFLATSIISPWWCLFLVSNVGLWLRSSLVMVKTFQSHNYLSSFTG